MGIERQLVWYKTSKDFPERHYWNFLLINEQREIEQIKQKLYDNLGYVLEETQIDKGKIINSDLMYVLFRIEATKPELDFSRIYKGKVRKDRILQPRKSLSGWNDLINKIALGEFE